MKASAFKPSYRTLLDNAVERMNEESFCDTVCIHYDEDQIKITSRYLETSEIITLTSFDKYSDSDDLMAALIADLIYWANSSEYCSALKKHIRLNSKAA